MSRKTVERIHNEGRVRPLRPGGYSPALKRFECPVTGALITAAICEVSRRTVPEVCADCPVAPAPGRCRKCGRLFSGMEARAGFTTCERAEKMEVDSWTP